MLRFAAPLLSLLALGACTPLPLVGGGGSAVGPTWKLQTYRAPGGAVETFAVGSPDSYTLTLGRDGRAAGRAGCNRYSGPYTLSPSGAFDVKDMVSTLMACEPGSREDDFVRALDAATRAEATPTRLVLRWGAGGEMVFAPVPAPAR